MHGLLFYDPTNVTGEFYKVNEVGDIALLKRHTDWRNSWKEIIPGHFGGNNFTDLLFYEASSGMGEFYSTDGNGGIRLLEQHTGWRQSWTKIIPGNFGGNNFTDLLFYEAATGTGQFHTTNGAGGISLLKEHTGWRRSWNQIIPGNFGGNNFTDLLFYEAATGTGQFHTTNGAGGISLLKEHTGWRRSWTHILAGRFVGNPILPVNRFSNILFFEGSTGTAELYRTDGQANLHLLQEFSNFGTNWTHVIHVPIIEFSPYFFFFDANSGRGEFRLLEGNNFRLIKNHGLRSSWTQIIPGNFGGTPFNNLKAPTNLRVTSIEDRKITVSWQHVSSGETGFTVTFNGKSAGQQDHSGSKIVAPSERGITLTGLRSNFEYTIRVVAFNPAGNSPSSNAVTAKTPARIISVSKEGVGSSAVFIISGRGFSPGGQVVIKATDPKLNQLQFTETVGEDGKFVSRNSAGCTSGVQITFTAFEIDDPTGTFANAVVTSCP